LASHEGNSEIAQDRVAELISKIKFKVAFICLPKKKHLAQYVIDNNPMKRIIYFDFAFNNFTSEESKTNEELQIFEKMMMIKTVSQII
jgi:hypothetical protein